MRTKTIAVRARRMLQLCLALSLLCCSGIAATAQKPTAELFTATRLQLDVTKVLLAQQAAWNAGDLDSYLAHYEDSPETVALLGSRAHGLAVIRQAFLLNFPNKDAMGHLEDTEVEVRELGDDFALATGKYHLTRSRKAGGDADGTFTEIMQKTPQGWRIIFSENT